jgi:hypothetical protein
VSADRRDAALAALAAPDRDQAADQVDVGDGQADDLAGAGTGFCHQPDDDLN